MQTCTSSVDANVLAARQESRFAQSVTDFYDWKPAPLRWPFLTCLLAVFAACIVSTEVLLQHTIEVSLANSTSPAETTSSLAPLRYLPRQQPTSLVARQYETTNCDNTATLPARVAASKSASVSLCQKFTASYMAYTANMSYPIQTEVSQWLVQFGSASEGWRSAINSQAYCSSLAATTTVEVQPYDPSAQNVYTIDVLCTETVLDMGVCTGFGSAWITGFALSSTVLTVCAAYTTQVIDTATVGNVITPTTTPYGTSAPVTTKLIDTVTPTAKASSGPSSLPTITKTNGLLSLTQSGEPTKTTGSQHNTVSGSTDITPAPVVNYMSTTGAQSSSNNADDTGIVIVALPSSSVTVIQVDAQGSTKTTLVAVSLLTASAAAGKTESQNQETTVLTNSGGIVVPAAIVIYTSENGQLVTTTTPIQTAAATMINVLTTNSQGQVETLMLAADQLVPVTSTIVTTNSRGEPLTLTTVAYGVSGDYTTYITTDANGIPQTIMSSVEIASESRYTTTTQYTSLLSTTNADGSVNSFSAVVVETVVLTTTAGPATPTGDSLRAGHTSAPKFDNRERMVNVKYSSSIYAIAMYTPPLYAVLVKALWGMVFAAIKLIQPFQRMGSENGASAKDSIFAEYLSSSFSLDAFTSLRHGHVLPFLSGLLYILAQIGPPVYSASSTIKARSMCSYADGHQQRCDPVWVVDISLLRVSQAVLGLCVLVVLSMLWFLRKSRTGLASDPSSMASLATLLTHEPLLHDVQKIGSLADHTSYENALSRQYFRLAHHTTSTNQQLYGIVSTKDLHLNEDLYLHEDLPELDQDTVTSAYRTSRLQHDYQSIHSETTSFERTSSVSRSRKHSRKHLISDMCGFGLSLTLFALVLAFYVDYSHDAFNRFFNSGSWSSKLLLVGLATLCSLHLSHLERLVRVAEPFRRLSTAEKGSGHSEPARKMPYETSLLLDRSGTPYSTWPRNVLLLFRHELRGGSMSFQTLMSTTVIVADINIIATAGVAYNDAMTVESYQLSSRITLALTSWILLMYIIVLLWWRRTPAIAHLTRCSISKGVGTIGGCMRWLVAGQQGLKVLEAVADVKADHEHRARWHLRHDETDTLLSPTVWFSQVNKPQKCEPEVWSLLTSDQSQSRRQSANYANASLLVNNKARASIAF